MNLLIYIILTFFIKFVVNESNLNEILHPECGKGTNSPTDRIYGGSEATKGNWGWHVMLRKKVNPNGFCGGSLITDQWILTAAHCVYGQANPFNYYIDAGMQNRKIPDTWTKLSLKVSKIIVNSKFSWDTIQDDIALIKLEQPIQIDSIEHKITPVCLALSNEYYSNKTAYSTGFGVMNQAEQNSNVLREISIPLVSDQECISYNLDYGYTIDPVTQLCAGIKNGNKSASNNDSGGPLVVRGLDNRWRLVGIASWGYGGKGSIGFYTRINGFTNWIYQNIILN